jgi:hypothetical protein
MAKAPPHSTQRDVGAAVNNAILLVKETKYFKDYLAEKGPDRDLKRKQRLRAYVEAHIQTIKDHVATDLLHPDEAILILLSEAIVIAGLFYKGLKLPVFQDYAKNLLEDGMEIGDDE